MAVCIYFFYLFIPLFSSNNPAYIKRHGRGSMHLLRPSIDIYTLLLAVLSALIYVQVGVEEAWCYRRVDCIYCWNSMPKYWWFANNLTSQLFFPLVPGNWWTPVARDFKKRKKKKKKVKNTVNKLHQSNPATFLQLFLSHPPPFPSVPLRRALISKG